MKLWMLLVISCIVVDTAKNKCGWLTTCKGFEENGEVVLDKRVADGQMVFYKPFVHGDETVIHGYAGEVSDIPKQIEKPKESSDLGKPSCDQG